MTKHKEICPICLQLWKKNQTSLKCNICKKIVHGPGPSKSCSLLSIEEFNLLANKNNSWVCPKCLACELPFSSLGNGELYLDYISKEDLGELKNIPEDTFNNLIKLPDDEFQSFIDDCNAITSEYSCESNDELEELYNDVNSRYYGVHDFNKIKIDAKSTLSLCLAKHFDGLYQTLSSLKVKFDIIGITEHKIRKDVDPITNLDIEGYRPFLYDPTETTHGGTGFFISQSINFKKRDDLKFNSCGNFESTFIEIILPNRKNMVIGCVYRHPSSSVSINDFNERIIEPLLNKISTEGKLFSLMGDFNIDLMKSNKKEDINEFYTNLSSHFCAPYVLQPTRPISKTLIDNIFINTIEFNSYSGNLTVLLADHLFQFALLEGFFKETFPKKINVYERNFRDFNEREFNETLNQISWDSVLQLNDNDPNISFNNLHNNIVYLLDEFAPYRKITKKEFKLKAKPWIDHDILKKIIERDKL